MALVLLLEGVTIGTVAGFTYLTDSPVQAAAWRLAATVPVALVLPAYVMFLATLDTPLVRPFRHRPVLAGLWIAAVAAIVARLVAPGLFWIEFVPFGARSWDAAWTGPLAAGLFASIVVAYVYGLAAALDAFRRADPGTSARDRARIYAFAFGVRDAVAIVVVGAWAIGRGIGSAYVEIALTNTAPLVMVLLLAYGLLRYQLFDIDLKVKWTLKHSTVALVFVAVFLAATEGAQVVFGDDNPWFGIGAAVLLVFVLAPLQRFAERVSDKAMPHVQDTNEYRLVRKREVYRATLESVLEDGEVTDKERSALATLADQLGLSTKEALDLEREVASARGVV